MLQFYGGNLINVKKNFFLKEYNVLYINRLKIKIEN